LLTRHAYPHAADERRRVLLSAADHLIGTGCRMIRRGRRRLGAGSRAGNTQGAKKQRLFHSITNALIDRAA
jgi:hypothetical protein